ncbi:MAG TPA: hypothetical protein VGL97_13815 [Bryobacteraceae bacterium]
MNFAPLYLPVILAVFFLIFVVPVIVRLLRCGTGDEITAEWLENFSTATYFPMAGLLSDEDFRFLSRQPGFDFLLYRKLRRDRLRIFRQYLNRLIGDFNRLHQVARLFVAASQEDHSALLGRLIWLRVRFSFSVLRVEAAYLCCRFGFHAVVVSGLIARLDEMSRQLNALSANRLASSPSYVR